MTRVDALVRSSARAAMLTLCFACSSAVGPDRAAAPASPVVAEVDGQVITLAELDAEIGPTLYETRSEALDDMIDRMVLEGEAAKRGVDVDELVQQEIARLGGVGDEEIAAFFEENRQRLPPGETLENLSPRIRSFLESQRRGEAVESLRAAASVTVHLEPPRVRLEASGPSRGAADAAVTIIEFSDYQCPFCRRAEPVVQQVLDRYPKDVRLVFRHMPLDRIHPQARGAAVAAVCAHEQDRFWPFHERLFENQASLGPEDLTRIATEVGLDLDAFQRCRDGDAAERVVSEDLEAAQGAGARGTPAFFVNGVLLAGARPFEDFVEVIEQELAR